MSYFSLSMKFSTDGTHSSLPSTDHHCSLNNYNYSAVSAVGLFFLYCPTSINSAGHNILSITHTEIFISAPRNNHYRDIFFPRRWCWSTAGKFKKYCFWAFSDSSFFCSHIDSAHGYVSKVRFGSGLATFCWPWTWTHTSTVWHQIWSSGVPTGDGELANSEFLRFVYHGKNK